MSDELTALSTIVSQGIDTIRKAYAERGQTYPSLHDPNGSPAIEDDAQLSKATDYVVAAAAQLIATLRKPSVALLDASGSMYITATLGVAVETSIAELLREAGPKGLHIREISSIVGVDTEKLGRCLRFLATRHVFREVSPDVFANNRISAALDTGRTYESIKSRPVDKYENTTGVAAIVAHTADMNLKGSAHLIDHVLDPATSFSREPSSTPFARAFNTSTPLFDFLDQPGNEKRVRRFGAAMHVSTSMFSKDLVTSAFDWASLKDNELVVDVGGGIGSSTLPLARTFPHLRYVVQDRANVIPASTKFWKSEFPSALESGLVQFQAHSFFDPQPIKDASVFLLRFITHDWSDDLSRKIMRHLRASAGPQTKMVFLELVVPYACATEGQFADIPGADALPVPYPLLANLGPVSGMLFAVDMQMMNILNALERTIGQWVNVAEGTGWKLESVKRGPLCALTFGTI